MSKQHFASIDDIVDYYVVPALGMYADDFNVRNIARHLPCACDHRGLIVDTDEFGYVRLPSGKREFFWDIVRLFDTERDCTDEYQGQESL